MLKWLDDGKKFLRLRKQKNSLVLCHKNHFKDSVHGAEEIEIQLDVNVEEKVKLFLEAIGLAPQRFQEKRRHTFLLNNVTIDFDYWPTVPCYLEIEGSSEDQLKEIAQLLGLAWENAVFENAKKVLMKYYHIPLNTIKHFTFDKME